MPVAQMLKRISGYELAEWQAFEQLYGPIGVEARIDRAAALIAHQLAVAFTRKGHPPTIDDFMPRWGQRPVEGYEEGDAGGEHDP